VKVFVALALLIVCMTAPSYAEPADAVGPETRVGEFLGATGEAAKDRQAGRPASPWTVLLKLSAYVAVVLALSLGALILYRRWLPTRGKLAAAGWVRVLGRASLTPRHSVFVVRCGKRVIAVGISRERMTFLGELGEDEVVSETVAADFGAFSLSGPKLDAGGLRTRSSRRVPSEHLDSSKVPETADNTRFSRKPWGTLLNDWKQALWEPTREADE